MKLLWLVVSTSLVPVAVQGCSCLRRISVENALEHSNVVLRARVRHEVRPRRSLQSNETIIMEDKEDLWETVEEDQEKGVGLFQDEDAMETVNTTVSNDRNLNHLPPEPVDPNRDVYWSIQIQRFYKGGCEVSRRNRHRRLRMIVKTGGNSALCGVTLSRGTWLLSGDASVGAVPGHTRSTHILSVSSCEFQGPFRDLDGDDRRLLRRTDRDCYDQSCERTSDCGQEEFCSYGECRQMGSCRSTEDCYNPENLFPIPLIACPEGNSYECRSGGCSFSCCEQAYECLRDPCDNRCSQSWNACVEDYCGGCKAHFFLEDGSPVC